MSQRVKYDFREREVFAAFLFPAMFLPLYAFTDIPLLFKLSFYVLPAWLFASFSFATVRITDNAIIVISYLKPFRKVHRYTYKDLVSIRIAMVKSRWRIVFVFQKNKKVIIGFPGQVETMCKFFLDKGIPITSSNGEAWHFINEYRNDPRANYTRQQLRKAGRRK